MKTKTNAVLELMVQSRREHVHDNIPKWQLRMLDKFLAKNADCQVEIKRDQDSSLMVIGLEFAGNKYSIVYNIHDPSEALFYTKVAEVYDYEAPFLETAIATGGFYNFLRVQLTVEDGAENGYKEVIMRGSCLLNPEIKDTAATLNNYFVCFLGQAYEFRDAVKKKEHIPFFIRLIDARNRVQMIKCTMETLHLSVAEAKQFVESSTYSNLMFPAGDEEEAGRIRNVLAEHGAVAEIEENPFYKKSLRDIA